MNSEKIIRTYLLANPNLKGEIYLKGVRLVTSQILGKFFFKKNLAHEIIPSFMHSFIFVILVFEKIRIQNTILYLIKPMQA
jgi:hypothetical protein